MPTPAEIIDTVASLMNDTAQTVFTDAAVLPYLNTAIDELKENLQQNNIALTNETSANITVPAGTTVIGFGTAPSLPPDLIEIQQLWESPTGTDTWTPMTRREFLPEYFSGITASQFLFFAWRDQKIHVPEANQDNDLRLNYIKDVIPTPITIGQINDVYPIINIKSYLAFHTAALCAMFIHENPTRAEALENSAQEALARTLGISNKGKQGIMTRRRPFRSSYKSRGVF